MKSLLLSHRTIADENEDLDVKTVDDNGWLVIHDRAKVHDLNFDEYSEFLEVDDIISEKEVGTDDDFDADDTSGCYNLWKNEVPSWKEAYEAINLLPHRYMAAALHALLDVMNIK